MTGLARVSARPSVAYHLVLMAALLTAAVGVQVVRDRGWQPYEPANPMLWVRSAPLMQRLVLSYDSLVADTYWMRAVVYYGGKQRLDQSAAQKNYDALFPLLDMVTTLDPHFKIAYRFGAIFLAEAFPQGPGRADQAIELLKRGIERDAGRWEYYHDIGFIYYWWLRDYQQAAEWFLKGADRPGAAEWLRPLAATTLATGGQRSTSRQLWTELLKSDMSFIQRQAELRLLQLDAMDQIAELTPVLQRFIEREHRVPQSWQELAVAEHLPRLPADPTGVPFVFEPRVGHIDVSRRSTLWPLPTGNQPPPQAPQ